jgi:hypothetical protein
MVGGMHARFFALSSERSRASTGPGTCDETWKGRRTKCAAPSIRSLRAVWFYTTRTFWAWGPFCPSTMSNSTA